MSERGLLLSPDKTVITHIEDGLDFLGQNVRKYCWAEFQGKTKLLIRPAVKSVKAQEEIPPSSVKSKGSFPLDTQGNDEARRF